MKKRNILFGNVNYVILSKYSCYLVEIFYIRLDSVPYISNHPVQTSIYHFVYWHSFYLQIYIPFVLINNGHRICILLATFHPFTVGNTSTSFIHYLTLLSGRNFVKFVMVLFWIDLFMLLLYIGQVIYGGIGLGIFMMTHFLQKASALFKAESVRVTIMVYRTNKPLRIALFVTYF